MVSFMIMRKKILEFVDRSYFSIGTIGDTEWPGVLYYMECFLHNLWLEEAKKGVNAYYERSINDFSIDYGDADEDYYVAFSNRSLLDLKQYEVEIDGQRFVDSAQIPKLKLSYENFDYVFKAWVQINEQNPKYLIITQDDAGWVGLQGKEELDVDEIALVEQCQRKQEEWMEERKRDRDRADNLK